MGNSLSSSQQKIARSHRAKDNPTMINIIAILLLAASPLFAQGVRLDSNAFTVSGSVPLGAYAPILAIPGSTVLIYTDAATTVLATTYTDTTLGTACPLSPRPLQATLPGSAQCISLTTQTGGFGFNLSAGNYWYTITTPNGAVQGPYAITAYGPAGGYTYDANFANFTNACNAAGGGTLALTRHWTGLATQAINCQVLPFAGGSLQPSSGQTLTLSQFPSAGALPWIDTSLGGIVAFSPPAGPVNINWIVGTSVVSSAGGTGDTSFAGLTGANNSLPSFTTGAGTFHVGSIQLGGTGLNGAYRLAQTFNLSPRVTLIGSDTGATTIQVPISGGFTGSYMINVPNLLTSAVPNANFYSGVKNVYLDACIVNDTATGCLTSALVNGLKWLASIGSTLHHMWVVVGGNSTAYVVGGSGGGNDNTSGHDNTAQMMATGSSGGSGSTMHAHGWDFPTTGNASTFSHYQYNAKLQGLGLGTLAPNCDNQPSIHIGQASMGIHFDVVDAENDPCVFGIDFASTNISITGLKAHMDCLDPLAGGVLCPQLAPYVGYVSPSAVKINIDGKQYGHAHSIELFDPWTPLTTYTATCPGFTEAAIAQSASCLYGIQASSNSVVDSNGCAQQITTGGISGSAPPSWDSTTNTCSPGSTTTDGTAIWTDRGLPIQCNPYLGIVRNCWVPNINTSAANNGQNYQSLLNGPAGSSSTTDTTPYYFSFDSGQFFNAPEPWVAGSLIGANMNTTADQMIPINWPKGANGFIPQAVLFFDTSVPLTTAEGGVYLATGKAGCAIVPNTQTYSAIDGVTVYALNPALASCVSGASVGSFLVQPYQPLYLSLSTPQGTAATINVYIYGKFLYY